MPKKTEESLAQKLSLPKGLSLTEGELSFIESALGGDLQRLEFIETDLGPKALLRGFAAPVSMVVPNDWNPNRMDDRGQEAVGESLSQFGQVVDCVCYVAESGESLVVVDGEHRLRQMEGEISVTVLLGYSLPELKKLTAIFIETKGRPDQVSLSALLANISGHFGDSLRLGLPYSSERLSDMLTVGKGDISDLLGKGDEDEEDEDEEEEELPKAPGDFDGPVMKVLILKVHPEDFTDASTVIDRLQAFERPGQKIVEIAANRL